VIKFMRSLRGQLILTYTTVTVLALLALEILAMAALAGAGILSFSLAPDPIGYFSDVVSTLAPQARPYLQPGAQDLPGLQAWLEQVRASGQASLPPQHPGDSPAALIVPNTPLFVLSPQGDVLVTTSPGAAPLDQPYLPPNDEARAALDQALAHPRFGSDLYARQPDGSYFMAVPVAVDVGSPELAGVVVLTLAPPPAIAWSALWPTVVQLAPAAVAVVVVTGVVLLLAVAPFGALFGFIMSRGLTRRLARLSRAAEAWSAGDFTHLPQDPRQDEIGSLSRRLRYMAERLQTLMQSQQALAALQERNRLARELHDTVKQQTFATLMQVRAARNRLSQDPAEAERHLAEAEGLIKTAQQELGRLIAELRPAALDGQGLAAALRTYLETWADHAHIPATLHVQNERALPLETEQALYRVAQEALANAARHSRASAVTLRLAFDPEAVTLTVTDNGIGFDPRAPARGFGLESMRQRLAALGGRLLVESTAAGTTLRAEAPTSPASAATPLPLTAEHR